MSNSWDSRRAGRHSRKNEEGLNTRSSFRVLVDAAFSGVKPAEEPKAASDAAADDGQGAEDVDATTAPSAEDVDARAAQGVAGDARAVPDAEAAAEVDADAAAEAVTDSGEGTSAKAAHSAQASKTPRAVKAGDAVETIGSAISAGTAGAVAAAKRALSAWAAGSAAPQAGKHTGGITGEETRATGQHEGTRAAGQHAAANANTPAGINAPTGTDTDAGTNALASVNTDTDAGTNALASTNSDTDADAIVPTSPSTTANTRTRSALSATNAYNFLSRNLWGGAARGGMPRGAHGQGASRASKNTSVSDFTCQPFNMQARGQMVYTVKDRIGDFINNILGALSAFPRLTWAIIGLLAVLVIVILVGVGSCITGAGGNAETNTETLESATTDNTAEEQTVESVEYTLSPSDFSCLSASTGTIEGFSLSGTGEAPALSEEQSAAITSAISALQEKDADVGFVLVDADTGLGYSYNATDKVYGASSFKGPFAAFVCEHFVESGDITLEDAIQCIGQGTWGYYAIGEAPVRDLIEWSIVNSDNGSFGALREHFSGSTVSGVTYMPEEESRAMAEAFRTWLGSLGADISIADDDEWFPHYCAQDAARFWASISNYIDSKTETSQFLAEMLGSTETSFIREALEDTDASVIDKAGWYNDDPTGTSDYNSICDNGVVLIDGHKYVLCVMTSAYYSDSNVELVENLVNAVFATHASLSGE